jgi:hypothetical protein
VVDTAANDLAGCVELVLAYLERRGII